MTAQTLVDRSARQLGRFEVGPLADGLWRFTTEDVAEATGLIETDIDAGIAIIGEIEFDAVLRDIDACVALSKELDAGKAGVVGYCWGGTIAWLAATRTQGLACSVSYYGGGIANYQDEKPQCPLMLHFGEQDQSPTPEDARKVAEANPDAQAFFYPAGHGFNCDQRGSFDADSSARARERSIGFFGEHLG